MGLTQKQSDDEMIKVQQATMLELLPLISQPQNAKYQNVLQISLMNLIRGVEEIVRSEQIDMIAGRCSAKHGDKTFEEFIEMGGDNCPICMKKRLEESRKRFSQMDGNHLASKRANEARIRILEETLRGTEKLLKLANEKNKL